MQANFSRPTSKPARRTGFTLIELLIVIAIISALAALIFPVTAAVNKNKIRSKARAELKQVESAIENYRATLGYYPPDNPANYALNQLFYELQGTHVTSAIGSPPTSFNTLADNASISISTLSAVFGSGPDGKPLVGGFANCSRGAGDEGRQAKNFLASQLNPAQVTDFGGAKVIVCSIPSPQSGIKPPVCYNASNPAHNKNSFDLWMDVVVGSQTNRICNWSDKPLIIGAPTYP